MKKHFCFLTFLLCLFWIVGVTPAYSLDAIEQILKAEDITTEESISSAVNPKTNLESILETVSYDAKTVYLDGLQAIEAISRDIEEFNYWENGEIVDFKLLRSFETGYVTHALFEILGANGQYGYLIYDCENHEADSFSASESPYKLADDAIRSDTDIHITGSIVKTEPYYFYAPMSYGYGVINASGLMDIYNIRNMVSGTKAEVLTNVSFETTKIKVEEERVGKIIGDSEAIKAYEARKAEIQSMGLSYPNYYLFQVSPIINKVLVAIVFRLQCLI